MAPRPWSRIVLALLLLWQLDAAVAAPYVPDAVHASGAPADHCARHSDAMTSDGSYPFGTPDAPAAPDCCHQSATACHCAQAPALALPTFELRETRPREPGPLGRAVPYRDTRTSDFFRPPI